MKVVQTVTLAHYVQKRVHFQTMGQAVRNDAFVQSNYVILLKDAKTRKDTQVTVPKPRPVFSSAIILILYIILENLNDASKKNYVRK